MDELAEALTRAGITRQVNEGRTWYVDPHNSTGWADPYAALEWVGQRNQPGPVDSTCPGCGVPTMPPVPALRGTQSGAYCSIRCWLFDRTDAPSFVRPEGSPHADH